MRLVSEIREGLFIGWDAIRANKLRSALATLGIVIGVVTVTSMATAIAGLHGALINSLSALGGDVFHVSRVDWLTDTREKWLENRRRTRLTIRQARELADRLTLAQAVAPTANANAPVSFEQRDAQSIGVVGTTEDYVITAGISIAEGRFLSPAEVEGGRPVCVLGAEIAANLFPDGASLGKRIRLGPTSFEVIGVLERQGGLLGMLGADNQAIIPLRQLVAGFWWNPDCTVQVKALSLETMDETREEIRGVLRTIRGVAPGDPDDFTINEQEQFTSMFNRIAGTIAAAGLFVTGLSLFVGGIGIMNIMFVSVTERTREIGIRKAIGARERTILIQFLIEAMSICLAAGILALAIAWPVTVLMGTVLPAKLSLPIVAMALAISTGVGVISGYLPALRAARMSPVDALRNE